MARKSAELSPCVRWDRALQRAVNGLLHDLVKSRRLVAGSVHELQVGCDRYWVCVEGLGHIIALGRGCYRDLAPDEDAFADGRVRVGGEVSVRIGHWGVGFGHSAMRALIRRVGPWRNGWRTRWVADASSPTLPADLLAEQLLTIGAKLAATRGHAISGIGCRVDGSRSKVTVTVEPSEGEVPLAEEGALIACSLQEASVGTAPVEVSIRDADLFDTDVLATDDLGVPEADDHPIGRPGAQWHAVVVPARLEGPNGELIVFSVGTVVHEAELVAGDLAERLAIELARRVATYLGLREEEIPHHQFTPMLARPPHEAGLDFATLTNRVAVLSHSGRKPDWEKFGPVHIVRDDDKWERGKLMLGRWQGPLVPVD